MDSDRLYDAVVAMDKYLDRKTLSELKPEEALKLLSAIDRFHHRVQQYQETAQTKSSFAPTFTMEDYLITAGVRLCSDLSEAVVMRMVDIIQTNERDIEAMSQVLREKIKNHTIARDVVRRVQGKRNVTQEIGNSSGLGMVL